MSNALSTCSKCGAALPTKGAGSLCPTCTARFFLAAASELQSGIQSPASDPPAEGSAGGFDQGVTAATVARWQHLEILDQIGEGGMGMVHEAKDQHLGRTVALKRLKPAHQVAPRRVARFLAEAQIASQLEHPGIVPVHELGFDANGEPFYTMRRIQGVTLASILSELKEQKSETIAKYPLGSLLIIFQKICDAVAYAHSRKVIHRDLKPENIMIGEFGEVMVMDWGLAKVIEEAASLIREGDAPAEPTSAPESQGSAGASPTHDESRSGGPESSSPRAPSLNLAQTLDDTILGTLGFMAPEQASGASKHADERTDIFALGAILYNILTLHPPVRGRDRSLMLDRTKSGDVRPPVDYNPRGWWTGIKHQTHPLTHCPGRRIPEALSAVAMRAMATKSEDRYRSVHEVQRDIQAHQTGFATIAEDASLFALALMLLRRRKSEARLIAFGFLVPVLILFAFALHISRSERRIGSVLADLKGTAPIFASYASSLVEQQKFPEALSNIERAISLDPDNGEFFSRKGNILQSLLRLDEAAKTYNRALRLIKTNLLAEANFQLSRKLIQDNLGRTNLLLTSLNELQIAMNVQKRFPEAVALLRVMDRENVDRAGKNKRLLDTCRSILAAHGMNPDGELRVDDIGVHLDFGESPITDLAPIKDLPLASLSFRCDGSIDLSPLHGMKLQRLDAGCLYNGRAKLNDISPLKGMPLTYLRLRAMPVRDLSPLQEMPLRTLWLEITEVSDLYPIRALPLKDFTALQCPISDVSPLADMPLTRIALHGTKVTDLSPLNGKLLTSLISDGVPLTTNLAILRNMPLTRLGLTHTDVDASALAFLKSMPIEELHLNDCTNLHDLSPLKGLRLQVLGARRTQVSDLTQLRGMPLRHLDLEHTPVVDLVPLKGLAFDALSLGSTKVADLGPLAGANIKILYLENTPVKDLEPLRGMPLEELGLGHTEITDLSPLHGAKVKRLWLQGCGKLNDMSPLAECKELEQLVIPKHCRDIEFLRLLPKLQFLEARDGWDRPKSATEFWKEYDARKATRN